MQMRQILLVAGWMTLVSGGQAAWAAEVENGQVDAWFRELGALGRASMLEPAGSHGSTGMSLGAGASAHPGTQSGLARSELKGQGERREHTVINQVQIVKGLPLPVDVAFTGGKLGDEGFTQAAGHLQWTFYEDFMLPAFAARGGFGRVFGLEASTLKSESLELAASYGFLRILNVYGSVGAVRHTAQLSARPETEAAYLLATGDETKEFERRWTTQTRTVGARVLLLPPFVAVTAEAQHGDEGTSYATKLSVGI